MKKSQFLEENTNDSCQQKLNAKTEWVNRTCLSFCVFVCVCFRVAARSRPRGIFYSPQDASLFHSLVTRRGSDGVIRFGFELSDTKLSTLWPYEKLERLFLCIGSVRASPRWRRVRFVQRRTWRRRDFIEVERWAPFFATGVGLARFFPMRSTLLLQAHPAERVSGRKRLKCLSVGHIERKRLTVYNYIFFTDREEVSVFGVSMSRD